LTRRKEIATAILQLSAKDTRHDTDADIDDDSDPEVLERDKSPASLTYPNHFEEVRWYFDSLNPIQIFHRRRNRSRQFTEEITSIAHENSTAENTLTVSSATLGNAIPQQDGNVSVANVPSSRRSRR